jgi:hypothetical protein
MCPLWKKEPDVFDEVRTYFVNGDSFDRLRVNAWHSFVIDDLIAKGDARKDFGVEPGRAEPVTVYLRKLDLSGNGRLCRWHTENRDRVGICRYESIEVASIVGIDLALHDIGNAHGSSMDPCAATQILSKPPLAAATPPPTCNVPIAPCS